MLLLGQNIAIDSIKTYHEFVELFLSLAIKHCHIPAVARLRHLENALQSSKRMVAGCMKSKTNVHIYDYPWQKAK